MVPKGKGTGEAASGLRAAIAAFTAWGLLPAYWKLLGDVPALGILGHRILWSLLFLVLVMLVQGRRKEMLMAFHSKGIAAMLFLSSIIIAANWLIYIWAVNADMVLETSLGYYINPLVTVFFGFIFYRERMEKIQWLAIALAAAGVMFQVLLYGRFPWVAVGLALTFATYGLIRKKVVIDAIPGLLAETAFLAVPAFVFLLFAGVQYRGTFLAGDPFQDILLVATGAATSLPLLWFAYGARRLKLTTIGFLQYIGPTLTFILGVAVFHEPLDLPRAVTFSCIWAALGLYSYGNLRASRRDRMVIEMDDPSRS